MEVPSSFLQWVDAISPPRRSRCDALDVRPVVDGEIGRGWGVFVRSDLPPGAFVGYYTGCYAHHSKLSTAAERTHALSVGFSLDDPGKVIDGRIVAEAVRRPEVSARVQAHLGAMINSAQCEGRRADALVNVEVRRDATARAHVGDGFAAAPVYTTRAVRAGEQLLFYYRLA